MSRDFDELVDLDGLTPDEQARLRRVHDLLVAAGPPAELPAGLRSLPVRPARAVRLPPLRRPRVAMALLAAALLGASFGGGYLAGSPSRGPAPARAVALRGVGSVDALGSLHVGAVDADGNWPIELSVERLPVLRSEYARYALMLVRDGKPALLCGAFRAGRVGTTTVSFSVPYRISPTTRWVVTELDPGAVFPGRVVMSTAY